MSSFHLQKQPNRSHCTDKLLCVFHELAMVSKRDQFLCLFHNIEHHRQPKIRVTAGLVEGKYPLKSGEKVDGFVCADCRNELKSEHEVTDYLGFWARKNAAQDWDCIGCLLFQKSTRDAQNSGMSNSDKSSPSKRLFSETEDITQLSSDSASESGSSDEEKEKDQSGSAPGVCQVRADFSERQDSTRKPTSHEWRFAADMC